MKLNDEQIRRITKGAIEISQNEGWLCFYRFSKATLSHYAKQGDNPRIRSRSSSGVRFDFTTNAESMKISYALFPGSSQTRGSFDFFVNGKLYSHLGENLVDGVKRSVEAIFPKGEKHVTVYFPTLAETKISSVELSDGASVVPCETKEVAVFYGDSITQGYVTDFPSLCYPPLYSSLADLDFYNFGVGGDVFNLGVLETEVPVTPSTVFVAYGTNDWGARASIHSFKSEARGFFKKLCDKYPTSRLVAILPLWRADNSKVTKVGTFDEMHSALLEVVGEFNRLDVVKGLELVPHVEELFFDKFLHPNEIGFSYYARELFLKMSK